MRLESLASLNINNYSLFFQYYSSRLFYLEESTFIFFFPNFEWITEAYFYMWLIILKNSLNYFKQYIQLFLHLFVFSFNQNSLYFNYFLFFIYFIHAAIIVSKYEERMIQ